MRVVPRADQAARPMHVAFSQTDHRPWPLPARRWAWRQSWHDLLFAHWPVPAAVLRRMVPAGLDVQEFDGTSWVGLVPFRMSGVVRRPLPDLPWISAFPEVNVRLYVQKDGKPGVWFLSLDAANPLAVWAARRFFHLPYYRAAMSMDADGDGDSIRYASRRPGAALAATYGPTSGGVYQAAHGSLEHFLTERYCLYAAAPDGSLWRNDIHHVPWPLQPARAALAENTLLSWHGLPTAGPPALLHFARRLDVVVWTAEQVAPARGR
jgi:uncharacterized protein YqjF (DUF2071 family)